MSSFGKNIIKSFPPELQTQWTDYADCNFMHLNTGSESSRSNFWRDYTILKKTWGFCFTETVFKKTVFNHFLRPKNCFRNFVYYVGSNTTSLHFFHAVYSALMQCSEVLKLQNYQIISKSFEFFTLFRRKKQAIACMKKIQFIKVRSLFELNLTKKTSQMSWSPRKTRLAQVFGQCQTLCEKTKKHMRKVFSPRLAKNET